MGPLARLGVAFRRGFGRVTPDPFVLAVGLSLAVLLAAIIAGDWPTPAGTPAPAGLLARMTTALDAWAGSGLWKLLAFAMQMVLMLVLGTALAEAPIVRRGIARLARVAQEQRVQRPPERGEHPDRDERVHGRRAVPQVRPGRVVERPRAPGHHGRR